MARCGSLSRWIPMSIGTRLILAVAIEASWEVVENTDWLINRYRGQTVALDYYGDSVINSVADTLFMVVGFFLARWWPVWLTIAVAIALELIVGYMIRDNLTLNVLMLLWPVQVDPRLAGRQVRRAPRAGCGCRRS